MSKIERTEMRNIFSTSRTDHRTDPLPDGNEISNKAPSGVKRFFSKLTGTASSAGPAVQNPAHFARATQARVNNALLPADKSLPAFVVVQMSHETHGDAEISCVKLSKYDSVQFQISLKPHNGQTVVDRHIMYVDNRDSDHHNASTLGYGDIDLKQGLRGKGVGYLYHLAAAEVARKLGITFFVVNNVLPGPMTGLCTKSGMALGTASSYELSPETLIENLTENLNDREWIRHPVSTGPQRSDATAGKQIGPIRSM